MSSFWKQRLRIADPTRFFKYHPHTTLRSVYYKTYIYLLKMVYMCVFLNLIVANIVYKRMQDNC